MQTRISTGAMLLLGSADSQEVSRPSSSSKLPRQLRFVFTQLCLLLAFSMYLALPSRMAAQQDQGAIIGTVTDATGAVIAGAKVNLTNTDIGLVLTSTTSSSGGFVFSPIKIGHYSVVVVKEGFETAVQTNLRLDIQQTLNVPMKLKVGNASETVTVTTAPPPIQTQNASVGQVITTEEVDSIPLSGRNWVSVAQLVAGVTSAYSTRGTQDFITNGQHPGQNNFLLDGVDNNSNQVDFLNGASYVILPPPDALAEFGVQTSNYGAEMGHSPGGVVNASIKSGTNQIHGSAWEYLRNTSLNAYAWGAVTNPPYHQNMFGGTLGMPIMHDKLFIFGDLQENRIAISSPSLFTVPTALMRTGDFSELLNPALSPTGTALSLYQPNSGGAQVLQCNGKLNVFCPAQASQVALKLLNLMPAPNYGGGLTYNNFKMNLPSTDNTFQFDTRMDWNISTNNQAYIRFSYYRDRGFYPPPFGDVLDGGNYASDGTKINDGQNVMLSWTHQFSPSLINEARVGYNHGTPSWVNVNADKDVSSSVGLGGVPYQKGFGGLPLMWVGGMSGIGATGWYEALEHMNVAQLLDNVTKVAGKHTLKAGVSFQPIRFDFLAPAYPRGVYNYGGTYTSDVTSSNPTGFGVADFVADQMGSSNLSNIAETADARWYNGAFFQDDWRVNRRLVVNLGLRYDYFQPYHDVSYNQGNFVAKSMSIDATTGTTTGTGVYYLSTKKKNVPLSATFLNTLAKDNIAVQYSDNPSLVNGDMRDWAPRVGFAYEFLPDTVIRAGFGMYYGALENLGGGSNLGQNYPFAYNLSFYNTAPCLPGNCPSLTPLGINLERGFTDAITQGLANVPAQPNLQGVPVNSRTPYTEQYNLNLQRAFSKHLFASLGYVGNVGRHLANGGANLNPALGLQNNANSSLLTQPFPDVQVGGYVYEGISTYNSLQAHMEKRISNGLSWFANYTWAHSLGDEILPLGNGPNYRMVGVLGYKFDYANSVNDTRHRVTFNGLYELPFGRGKRFLNDNKATDAFIGGWSGDLTFQAQSGIPFTVGTDITGPSGGSPVAILKRDPLKGGGSPDPTNPSLTNCPSKVKTIQNWFNPCAFANPLSGTLIPQSGPGSVLTTPAEVLPYLGGKSMQVHGPGFENINLSLFKSFNVYRESKLQFRSDIFNVFNTPAYNLPSNTGISSAQTAGQITGASGSRYIQLALRYSF